MTLKSAFATGVPQAGLKTDLLKYVRLILTKGSGAGAALGLNILLARLLVPDLSGLLFFCIALATFASLVSRMGLDVACLKNISALPEEQQRSYLDRALILTLLANIPTIIIGALVVQFSPSTQADLTAATALFAIAALSLSLTNIASETLKARHRTGEGLFWQTVFQPALTLALIVLLGSELQIVVTCFAVSHVLAMLGSTCRARKRLQPATGRARVAWRDMLMLGTPLMLIAVMNSVIELSDTLLLGMLRSAGEVSIYYVCAKVAALSTTLLFIINGTVAPDISRRWAHQDHAGAFAVVRKYSRFMLGLAALILLGIGLLHDYILAVFGEQYREQGAFALLVLASGYFFVLAAGPLGIFMTMTGHHRQYLHNNIATCALNVLLNLLLIPRYGVNGACFATAVALAMKNILLYVQFKKIERSSLS
jgi:O-antigen/teichoic acid export membrane protein